MICSKCGKEIPENVAFCPVCGTPVKKKAFCGKCGAEIAPGQSFCAACGAPTPGSERAPATLMQTQQMQQYQANMDYSQVNRQAPQYYGQAQKVKADRSVGTTILLTLVTFGIYGIVVYYQMSEEINTIASKYDGKKTMNYLLAVLLTPVTLGIFGLVWMHQFCERIGAELKRRGISYQFGAKTYWLWSVLGCLILVGPFIFWSKLITAMNLLGENYNTYG